MARAIWSGSISFGLLNVPVKLYSAVARRGISLREIRESDGARIRHRRVAEGTDEEVPYEKIQKAFEITSGNYVPISKDEMAAMAPKKQQDRRAWPLGKLYEEGRGVPKKGSGRVRWKRCFSNHSSASPPAMVTIISQAACFRPFRNRSTTESASSSVIC